MRIALLLAALALSGCLDHARHVAPVVLVQESYQFDGPGLAHGFAAPACDLARLDLANGTVHEASSPSPYGPIYTDLAVIVDHGDSWRAGVANASQGHDVMRLGFGSGGWIGGGSSGSAEVSQWFDLKSDPLFNVSWRGGRAWLDESPLAEGQPVARSFRYDVPSDAGTLHVVESVSVTYLGKLRIVDEPMGEGCSRGLR